jgi:hypothetical protein
MFREICGRGHFTHYDAQGDPGIDLRGHSGRVSTASPVGALGVAV